jgi:hypothetical protein
MRESEEALTDNEMKKKAYLAAQRLRHAGLDAETIYARLEKQGIPEAFARQAVNDAILEKQDAARQEAKEEYRVRLIILAVGIALWVIAFMVVPSAYRFVSQGIIGGVVASSLFARRRKKQ